MACRLVIDGNSVYEIDEDWERKKVMERKKMEKAEKTEKTENKEKTAAERTKPDPRQRGRSEKI